MDKQSFVAADVGNSAVKLLVLSAAAQLRRLTVRLDSPDWLDRVRRWISEQPDLPGCEWRISSVHRAAADRLAAAITSSKMGRVRRISHADIPMTSRIRQPSSLGIDRLLGAWSAHREFGGELVIVDAGSAITVDRVDAEGTFLGGAILPGLALQLSALATGTDALPAIRLNQADAIEMPATTTVNAIRLGVVAGAAGAIDRLVHLYRQQLSGLSEPEMRVVLTGGDAELLSPQLDFPHVQRPDLVCRGLLDLPRLIASPETARTRP